MARKRPLLYTAFNSAAVFVLGSVCSQKGPSFNDLILISDTDVEGGSFYVTASNFGFMLGSLMAGALYGRIKTRSMTIAIGLVFSGLLTCLVPQCTVFPAMLFMQALVSTCTGVYDTTVNADEIQAWDGNSQSAMQFLSFCFSVGGVISPLITRPFLAPKVTHDNGDNDSSLPSLAHEVSPIQNNLMINTNSDALCPDVSSNCTSFLENKLEYNLSTQWLLSNQSLESADVTSNLQYAYLITGVASILTSIPFFVLCIQSISKKGLETRKEKGTLPAKRKIPRATFVRLMALLCAFFFFHAMGTDSFGQYLFYFLVTHLDWSKKNGAYLMSLYWALGIPMKLSLVVIMKRVKTDTVIFLSVSGTVIGVVLFILAGHFHINALVWISCSCVAISYAPIYVGGYSWADGNLIPLGGKETSALMMSWCSGALCAPLILGVLMKNWSLMSFPYCVLIQVSTSTTIFLLLLCVVKPAMNRKYGPLRPHTENIVTVEDASEAMVPNENGKKTAKTLETNEVI